MKRWSAALLALTLVLAPNFVLAKPGGGGSSRPSFSGSRSSSSRSYSSPSRSYSAPSSRPSFSGSRSSSSAKSSSKSYSPSFSGSKSSSTKSSDSGSGFWSTTRSGGSTDRSTAAKPSAYAKAKAAGTTFTTRDEAIKAYTAKNASKYVTTFPKEPAARPTYVPPTTQASDGHRYTVVYNVDHGGYGYTNALGTWIMYSALLDNANRDRLMASDHYYYGPAPRGHGFAIFAVLLTLIIVVAGICWLGRSR